MPIAQTRLETLQITKLLQCVRDQDEEQIEKLTTHGVPHLINYNDPYDGDTALNIAAIANNDTMISTLLKLGAHPDVVDFKGRSAVMRAAEYGHVQCLEKLVKWGTDMKLTDIEGKGTLFYCISPTQRHSKCVEIIVEHGADVNNVAKDGTPVFVYACETAAENEEMCLMLLKKGADPSSKHQKSSRTALMAACSSGSATVVKAILERGAEVDGLMVRPRIHAAHEAAKGGFLPCLAALSAYDAHFDQVDEQGNSAIHAAAKGGHAMCTKFLSQRGCNPKPKNSDGNTARVIAKEEGHKDAVKECRKAEKSFGKTGKNNEPWAIKLYDFVHERQTQLLDMFKKFDADDTETIPKDDFLEGLQNMGAPMPQDNEMKRIVALHDKNKDGTVDYADFITGKKYLNKLYLMSAFEGKKKKKKGGKGKKKKGKTKIAMPICTQVAGPRRPDGGPPEMLISRHVHFTDSSRFDRDHPPEHPLQDDSAWYLQHPEQAFINTTDAARHADLDSIRDALAQGQDIDTKDKYYKTPLIIACGDGNMQVIKFLVENGANVNLQDNFKWTPLHHACHAGLKDIVVYLLEHGAYMEAVTMNGATPLMRAIESSKVSVVEYLIEAGAKMRVENRKSQTPMDIAVSFADPRVYDVVKAKWDSLPPAPDKKKGAKKGGKAPAKRPKSSTSPDGGEGGKRPAPDSQRRSDSPPLEALHRPRKGSILRAASALAGGLEEKEDVTYTPLKTWTPQKTTNDLIKEKEVKRERFGWEVDFPEFEMPFKKNVTNRVELMGGAEEE